MRVFDVLHMTGSTAWCFKRRNARTLVEGLSIVTAGAGGARIISVHIRAHVTRLVTTAA